jgi:hypothetical protein
MVSFSLLALFIGVARFPPLFVIKSPNPFLAGRSGSLLQVVRCFFQAQERVAPTMV